MASWKIPIATIACTAAMLAAAGAEDAINPRPNTPEFLQQVAEWKALIAGKESSPDALKAVAHQVEQAQNGKPSEAAKMLIAIARGAQMGPADGWFGLAQTRFSWSRLAEQHEIATESSIVQDAFRGRAKFFPRIDRNRDGKLAADDFDWSERSPYMQQAALLHRVFRRMDPGADGRVTRDDMQSFFNRIAAGKESITTDDLRAALLGGSSGFVAGDAPNPQVLLRGLFAGEIGSLHAGPSLGESAPDFRLTTHDGTHAIHLKEELAKGKPVVLVFGNFTCGPFRSLYPAVDDLAVRYRDDATFLAVYVREAHPTDGWLMDSNTQVGVQTAQPQTFDARVAVAQQCHAKLKYSMPLLVDEIDDPVGNAYSGMPARLYVIDAAGQVAFKSGRGPFGFKVGELEQALALLLSESPRP